MGKYIIEKKYEKDKKTQQFRVKHAIFYIDNKGNKKQISKWWDLIFSNGLIEGKSDYYIAQQDNEQAIFHKDDPEHPISKWWKGIGGIEALNDDFFGVPSIFEAGLVEGESDYYLALRKEDHKWAIFHKDDPEHPISGWWRIIDMNGLLNGKNDYYKVENDDNEQAIFHKDDPDQPISKWLYEIYSLGLLEGKSDYYIAQNKDLYIYIFHKDNKNFFVFKSSDISEAENIIKEIKKQPPVEVFFKYNNLC